MPRSLRYALRFVPLLLLALLLLPERQFISTLQGSHTGSFGSSSYTDSTLYGLAMPSAQEGWAVGGSFKILMDANGAQHSVPEHGTLLHYQHGSWTAQTMTPQPKPIFAIAMTSPNEGWAVGYAGWLAHYSGGIWQQVGPVTNASLYSITLLSAGNGWAVGTGGVILHLQGQHWSTVTSPTQEDLWSVSMLSPREGWAVGARGTMLHYEQGIWRLVQPPTRNTLRSITMLSAQEGWAVGEQGVILHYRDGIWNLVDWSFNSGGVSTDKTLYTVMMTSERTGLILGSDYFLSYDKEIWQAHTFYPDASMQAVVMVSPQEGWAVGDSNMIYHYQSGQWSMYVE